MGFFAKVFLRTHPNDAIIVATCIKHGITEIATFDADFENVPF